MPNAAAEIWLCEVAGAYRRGDLETCQRRLRTALTRFPDDARCQEWQGLVYHAKGDFAAARRALEAASLAVPLSITAQLALAEAYHKFGARGDAVTILCFLAERGDVPTPHLPRLSAALARVGEYQRALDVCREASQREPDDDEACFGMAYFMNKLGYPTECVLPLMRRALDLEPGRPIYRLSVGVVYVRLGQFQEAYELLCGVDPKCITCATCLDTIRRLYERFQDVERRDAVRRQAERVAEMRRQSAARCRGPAAHGTKADPGGSQ